MDAFEKIVNYTKDDRVELGASFKELLNTELCLGMTRYVCRNGTLSDGHEKITKSQRYYQAIREMYSRANEIRRQRAEALEAQADLVSAKRRLKFSFTKSAKMRAEAAVIKAEDRLMNSLVHTEDMMRQLDEFNKVRLELQDEVRAKYPMGIEQAEPDNWVAVAEYRARKKRMGYDEQLTHIPLDAHEKAVLGFKTRSPELLLWLEQMESEDIQALAGGNVKAYLEMRESHLQQKQMVLVEGIGMAEVVKPKLVEKPLDAGVQTAENQTK